MFAALIIDRDPYTFADFPGLLQAWFQDAGEWNERRRHLGNPHVKRSIGQYARGSSDEMTDRLRSFDVDHAVMCFSDVPFGLDDPDDLARFAQDVLPYVRD